MYTVTLATPPPVAQMRSVETLMGLRPVLVWPHTSDPHQIVGPSALSTRNVLAFKLVSEKSVGTPVQALVASMPVAL